MYGLEVAFLLETLFATCTFKDGEKGVQASEHFFKVASCSKDRVFSVGTVLSKVRGDGQAPKDSGNELSSSVASSLQMQLMALYFDRLFRLKTTEKFKQMLDLFCSQLDKHVFDCV